MRILLQHGARVLKSESRGSALNTVAGLCDHQAVALLLEFDADPNARAINGDTPLMGAAFAGSLPAARLLIEAGADENAKDDDGKSVLAYASRHPEMVEFLLGAGAR
jgi:hypothetical protein